MNYSSNLRELNYFVLSILLAFSSAIYAAPPANYYAPVNISSPETLHASLHNIIKDHQRYPYTSTTTDVWDIIEAADQDPNNPANVLTIYKNASYTKVGGGNSFYNREHSWPKSYGFPNNTDGVSNYPYTDGHHLFAADSSYNSSRSNKPYDNCLSGCTEKTTEINNNRGGTSTESNWTAGSFAQGKWETWSGRRGDVARALMYMAVRYDGGNHSITGFSEPDLRLTDDINLIAQSNTGANISIAYMGLKSVLLQWAQEDPVDANELHRNDVVFGFQGNRNPFVDHPEYIICVFANDCSALGGSTGGDTTPPSTPVGLSATATSSGVNLSWTANNEPDLAGYYLYISLSGANNFTRITASSIGSTNYSDAQVNANTSYDYYLTAVDSSANESNPSPTLSITTQAVPAPSGNQVWINEFHYDNNGSDVGEFIEIAGNAGIDLSGWQLIAYNGSNGASYSTLNLSGSIPAQSNGFGTINFAFAGLQNGAPDGIALIDNLGSVVLFLSYEGSFTATTGPASGLSSVDVAVSETSTTPIGQSLQLIGTGTQYSDFSWKAPSNQSPGAVNSGQSFISGSPLPSTPMASFTLSCNNLDCQFNGSASSASGSSISSYNWDFGDSQSATGVNASHSYLTAGSFTAVLTIQSADGQSATQTQVVNVIAPPSAPDFYQNTQSQFIPDHATVTSDLNVLLSSAKSTATVSVNITHTYRGDISLRLTTPSGDFFDLKAKKGSDSNNNIIASYPISLVNNVHTSGLWTLIIADNYWGDSGTLNSWSIQF